jgi:predicted Zn-dependent peptidase
MNRFYSFLPVLILASSAASPALAAPASSPVQVVSPFERIETLPNGLRLVSKIDREAPRVALSLQVRVGAGDETAQNAGWRRLLVGAALRGVPIAFDGKTKTDDDLGLTRLAEGAGGDAGINVSDDLIEFWAVGDSARTPQLLELLLGMWQSPRLSDDDIARSRTRLSEQLDAQDLDLAAQTNAALRSQEFADENGQPVSYGLSEIGTTASLEYLTAERVRELGRRVAGSPATLSAVGDVDLNNLRARLSALPSPQFALAPAPKFKFVSATKPAVITRDAPVQVALVFVSYPLGHVSAQEAPMLRLLSAALSDIPNARLTKRLLSTSSGAPQAFSLSSQFVQRRDGSELLISAQTVPSRVQNVTRVILDEVRRLRDEPLSPQEFAVARDFARGDWALARQSLRDRAFLVGQSTTTTGSPDGLWPQMLAESTPQKAQAVAKRTLRSFASVLVVPK